MSDDPKRRRVEESRKRAREKVRKDLPCQEAILDAYRSVHGAEPDSASQAESHGFAALVAWLKGSIGDECDRAGALPPAVATALRSALETWPSLFGAASYLIDGFPEPLTDRQQVWISYGGQVYHRYSDCSLLREGRAKSGRDSNAGLTSVSLAEARNRPGFETSTRRACKDCMP